MTTVHQGGPPHLPAGVLVVIDEGQALQLSVSQRPESVDLPTRTRADGIDFILALLIDLTAKPCAKLVPIQSVDELAPTVSASRATPRAHWDSSPVTPNVVAVPDAASFTPLPFIKPGVALELDSGTALLRQTGGLDHGGRRDPAGLAQRMTEQDIAHELLSAQEAGTQWPQLRFEGPVLFHPEAGVVVADAAVARRRARHDDPHRDPGPVGGRRPGRRRHRAGPSEHRRPDPAGRYRRGRRGAWLAHLAGRVGVRLDLPVLRVTQQQRRRGRGRARARGLIELPIRFLSVTAYGDGPSTELVALVLSRRRGPA
jgi:hypothetical protein